MCNKYENNDICKIAQIGQILAGLLIKKKVMLIWSKSVMRNNKKELIIGKSSNYYQKN